MTTRPQTLRHRHLRIQRRSIVVGAASLSLIVAGIVIAVMTSAVWSLALVVAGVSLAVTYVLLRPRLQNVRRQLDQVERLRRAQQSAAMAQRAAMQLTFQQGAKLRTPLPSSSGSAS